ncbi:MAG TPA: aminodeoxychorismate lyase [Steroidobacteraceae bacterium]|jgi:4-amino-4-deoxychorismate lyase|nr:aminodeoxychorismate lyase [Steroidobacteraceae bacterium]
MNAATTLINGRPGDQVCASERALHYGDGLFETISCLDGRPRWLDLHLQRLRKGCERLQLPFDAHAALAHEVALLAEGQPRCIVKVIVSRGRATRRGYRPSGEERPTRIVSRHEWPPDADGAGLRVGISAVRLGSNALLAGLKHLNRLEQVLAQLQRPADADEVLMLSGTQQVISGSMSNVFFADQDGLFTPDLRECGVEGVMRRVVLAAAGGVAVRPVAAAELAGVREAFMTNVRWGVRSVALLDGRALPGDDYARQLRRLIDGAAV